MKTVRSVRVREGESRLGTVGKATWVAMVKTGVSINCMERWINELTVRDGGKNRGRGWSVSTVSDVVGVEDENGREAAGPMPLCVCKCDEVLFRV